MTKRLAIMLGLATASLLLTGGAEAARTVKPKKEKVEYLRAAGSEPPPAPARKGNARR